MFPSHLLAYDTTRSSLPGSTRRPRVDGRVLIRRATAADAGAVARIAALDSRGTPVGELLVAEVDGEMVAAMPLDGGETVADPFRHTADVVRMLDIHAEQLRMGDPEAPSRGAPGIARPLRALTR